MIVRSWTVLGILALFTTAAAQDLTPEQWLWAIKTESSSMLHEIPNFNCLESISTSVYSSLAQETENGYSQLQIAFVNGMELYARPGESHFSTEIPVKLVDLSFATTGLYCSLARGLMGENLNAEFVAPAKDTNRQRDVCFRFAVPVQKAPWRIGFEGKTATAGERGSFWANGKDRLLRKVSVDAVDISPKIALLELHVDVRYMPVAVGGKRVLLPAFAHTSGVERNGRTHLSDISFTHCRAFVSDSTVSFDR